MSPEQTKGKAVTKATDIWAFGCVLFELLTGKATFHGEDVTDILAAVVRAEPDWQALPAATPLKVRDLLRRCLQKDKTLRMQSAGDVGIEIHEALTDSTAAEPSCRGEWFPCLKMAPAGHRPVRLLAGDGRGSRRMESETFAAAACHPHCYNTAVGPRTVGILGFRQRPYCRRFS